MQIFKHFSCGRIEIEYICIYHTSPAHVSESHPLTQALIETLNSNEIFLEIEQ